MINKKNRSYLSAHAFGMLTVMLCAVFLGLFGGPCELALADEDPAAPVFAEMDGTKIEGLLLQWVTQDSTVTADGTATPEAELQNTAHLYRAAAGNAEVAMTYRLEFQLSGQYDYKPGDLTITIPEKVWHPRAHAKDENGQPLGVADAGKLIGHLDLPFPQSPAKTADFNWQRIGGKLVLTNTATIGATSSVSIEVAICGVHPADVVDMSECDDITAQVHVVTNEGNVLEATSLPINAQIDTSAQLSGAYKSGTLLDSSADVPAALLKHPELTGTKDDYIYVRWISYPSRTGSQPYYLAAEETPAPKVYMRENTGEGALSGNDLIETGIEGIFLGCENYAFPAEPNEDGSYAISIGGAASAPGSTGNDYASTLYMYSAYRKADFTVPYANEPQIIYYMTNEIKWLLTELDAAVENAGNGKGEDPQRTTALTASATVTYIPAQWNIPTGHFKVHKWTEREGNRYWNYGYGLNLLESGREVDMTFVLQTIGYGYPWTTPYTNGLAMEMTPEGIAAAQASMGTLGWTQVTHDHLTLFDQGMEAPEYELQAEDFEIKSLRVEKPDQMRYGEKAGNYSYIADASLPTPDLAVEFMLDNNGVWIHAATAKWGHDGLGEMWFDDVNTSAGVSISGSSIVFPSNVTDIRHTFTSNVYNGKTMEGQCPLAMVDWLVYPTVTLKPSEYVLALVKELFELSDSPRTQFENDVLMDVYGWVKPDEHGEAAGLMVLEDDWGVSYATLEGAGYGVSLNKSVSFNARAQENSGDNDTALQRLILHYHAEMTAASNLTNRADYDDAVAMGVIPQQTSGVWYDLLPEGVVPLLDTVQLRPGDAISNMYTVPNYQGTGRTLLVVEAILTPAPHQNGGAGYSDSPSINFDASYGWDTLDKVLEAQNGSAVTLTNYIAFESTVDELLNGTLGTFEHQRGEPDNPAGGMNNGTPKNLPSEILAALTNLDPNTDEQRFVYDAVPVTVTKLNYAVSGLKKMVQDDLAGIWTQGLDGQEEMTVYEGHSYTYRLKVSSAAKTYTGDIVLYDSIENYIIPDPAGSEQDATKAEDYLHVAERKDWYGQWFGKGQWRGTLTAVDVSEFLDKGAFARIYYATEPGLQFADTQGGALDDNFHEDTGLFNSGNYRLDNRDVNVWTLVEHIELQNGVWTVPEGLNVTAIAIDARETMDGEAFLLEPDEHMTAYLHMAAPDDNGDPNLYHAKGAYARTGDVDELGRPVIDWAAALHPENNMYAYNNARMKCTQSLQPGTSTNHRMVRNDYTRVGIIPRIVNVEKVWDDDENHDGMRPASVQVTLMRRTAGVAGDPQPALDGSGRPLRARLSDDNGWTASFTQVGAADDHGRAYIYSFDEEPLKGYTPQLVWLDDSHYQLVNVHPKEQVHIHGRKVWNDDENIHGARPESVTLRLMRGLPAEGNESIVWTEIDSIVIDQGGDGTWSFDFGTFDRYAPGAIAYAYKVEEDYVPKYASVIVSQFTEAEEPDEGKHKIDLPIEGILDHAVKAFPLFGIGARDAFVYLDYENDTRIYGPRPPKKTIK